MVVSEVIDTFPATRKKFVVNTKTVLLKAVFILTFNPKFDIHICKEVKMDKDKKESQKVLQSVYLDLTTDSVLDARAKAEQTTKSELIRQYIDEGLSRPASMFSGYASKKADKHGFRKLAEGLAALKDDMSEISVQRTLKRLEDDYEEETAKEKLRKRHEKFMSFVLGKRIFLAGVAFVGTLVEKKRLLAALQEAQHAWRSNPQGEQK